MAALRINDEANAAIYTPEPNDLQLSGTEPRFRTEFTADFFHYTSQLWCDQCVRECECVLSVFLVYTIYARVYLYDWQLSNICSIIRLRCYFSAEF